jgi:LPXTG-site transpeptidase (sortase) family protein
LVALMSAGLCCTLGVVGGAVIGEVTGGLLSRGGVPAQQSCRPARVTPAPLIDRLPPATPSPERAATGAPSADESPPAPEQAPSSPDTRGPTPDQARSETGPTADPDPAAVPLSDHPVQAAAVALPANQPMRPATRVIIPGLGVDAPVVLINLQNGTWPVDQLTTEVGHMQGTASPGDPSNVALAGHVTLAQGGDGPFRDLSQLKQGDEVVVFAGDQPYRYLVTQVRIVAPEEVWVAAPTAEPVLTLITCANWNRGRHAYDDRIVAVARLAS